MHYRKSSLVIRTKVAEGVTGATVQFKAIGTQALIDVVSSFPPKTASRPSKKVKFPKT